MFRRFALIKYSLKFTESLLTFSILLLINLPFLQLLLPHPELLLSLPELVDLDIAVGYQGDKAIAEEGNRQSWNKKKEGKGRFQSKKKNKLKI